MINELSKYIDLQKMSLELNPLSPGLFDNGIGQTTIHPHDQGVGHGQSMNQNPIMNMGQNLGNGGNNSSSYPFFGLSTRFSSSSKNL